ncbi:Concanavalin A-like lectin protein kinase family protein [Perilla frutescens var. hirtella]|nr:Concanavalin A-like lectin protein kinase family protein [Perilla frutescens var. hirtella]KAH6807346.1 Concanavalin A-like lectin protein kinase family protein [Perilla frutescens var. frutescens]
MTSLSGGFSSASVITASFILLSLLSGDFSTSTEFDFGTLTFSRVKLLGEAHWTNGSVRLTRDVGVPNSGAGKLIYSKPIEFRLAGEQFPASFSTFFSFSIKNLNPSSIGGGLAFVISPDGESIGDAGGFMGIMGAEDKPNGVVAVEFDTLMDVEFKDINGNHVGLDVNSMVSTQVADLETVGVELKSGDLINSWVDYSGSTQSIKVYVSVANSKPNEPVISANFDLGEYIASDSMFVGFSGSTQASTETHTIEWWSFRSSFDETPSPNSAPPPATSQPPPEYPLMPETSIPPPPAAAPLAGKSNTTSHEVKTSGKCHNQLCRNGPGAVVGVVTAGAFFFAFCALAFMWAYNKKFKSEKKADNFASDVIKMPKEFSYKDLKLATKGFDSDRIIGNGAFGTVYKGIFPATGDIVAVKRCSHTGQGKAEFLSELSIIGTLRHRNLVRLQGWCHEKGEILLVYDLMSNGSLDKALFESRFVLPWPHRHKILIGVASALAYLHQECENQVIHRDIKSSNIMLDDGFNARLGDFGLARQIEHDKSPDATVAAGTMGYLAPEYLITGRATDKTDVFSYGAVALEVATGRRPIEKEFEGVSSNLVEWVWSLYREGRLMAAVDPRLRKEYDEDVMSRVLMVGLACSHPDPMVRPSARGVVQMLVGDAEVPIVPRTRPTMSFTTSQLLMTLQDSVSDLNGMITISTTSSECSFLGGGGGGSLDLV